MEQNRDLASFTEGLSGQSEFTIDPYWYPFVTEFGGRKHLQNLIKISLLVFSCTNFLQWQGPMLSFFLASCCLSVERNRQIPPEKRSVGL